MFFLKSSYLAASRVECQKASTTQIKKKLYNFVSINRQTKICWWFGRCRGYRSLRAQFVVAGQIVWHRGVDVGHLLLAWLMPFMLLLQTIGYSKRSVWFGLASSNLPDLKDDANEPRHNQDHKNQEHSNDVLISEWSAQQDDNDAEAEYDYKAEFIWHSSI